MKIHCLVRSTLFVLLVALGFSLFVIFAFALFMSLAVTVLFRRSAATSAPRCTTSTLHSRVKREFLAHLTFDQFDARELTLQWDSITVQVYQVGDHGDYNVQVQLCRRN